MTNLALNKPALQSSTSAWSTSRVPQEDAAGGNNGDLNRETGFHTDTEINPWWQVDLQAHFLIRRVSIFNRRHCASRLRYFSLLTSLDGKAWQPLFRKHDDSVFGDVDDLPYTYVHRGDHLARFVRVRLDGLDCLHFRECEIFGDRPDPRTCERILEERMSTERHRRMVPTGRRGRVIDVDDCLVFVDSDNYNELIVRTLEGGGYEARERKLVKSLIKPGDKVIEAGTAIGVVTMAAASIVGPANMLTFDANADVVNDARANFKRNDLQNIKSRVGVLWNRKAIGGVSNRTVDFYVAKEFWASRLNEPDSREIRKKVKVPVFCLEDEIKSHSANVLICDIEGGEADLLSDADLNGINLIIMETHYWSAGESSIDSMIRKLILDGFAMHLGHSGDHMAVLRR